MRRMASPRRITLRKEDVCVGCGCLLGVGVDGWWDAKARTVTCPMCKVIDDGVAGGSNAGVDGPAPGTSESQRAPSDSAGAPKGRAGASALREYERRRDRREKRVRDKHPLIGGVLLALQGSPQHEAAFKKGAAGERAVAESLEKHLAGSPVVLLHDRRMPRGHGNIDHLAVAPTGVYIIDAKNIDGKVRIDAPLFGPKRLMINGRNRTKLIDGLDRQVEAIKAALGSASWPLAWEIPVHGVLCFLSADLPLLGGLRMRGHHILRRRAVVKRLEAPGPLDDTAIRSLADHLATAFPAA